MIVDFAGVPELGSRVRLRNRLGTGGTREVLAFRIARTARDHSHIPEILADDVPRFQRSQATALREFSFRAGQMMHGRGWVIGGKAFEPTRTDVSTSLGAVEVSALRRRRSSPDPPAPGRIPGALPTAAAHPCDKTLA